GVVDLVERDEARLVGHAAGVVAAGELPVVPLPVGGGRLVLVIVVGRLHRGAGRGALVLPVGVVDRPVHAGQREVIGAGLLGEVHGRHGVVADVARKV